MRWGPGTQRNREMGYMSGSQAEVHNDLIIIDTPDKYEKLIYKVWNFSTNLWFSKKIGIFHPASFLFLLFGSVPTESWRRCRLPHWQICSGSEFLVRFCDMLYSRIPDRTWCFQIHTLFLPEKQAIYCYVWHEKKPVRSRGSPWWGSMKKRRGSLFFFQVHLWETIQRLYVTGFLLWFVLRDDWSSSQGYVQRNGRLSASEGQERSIHLEQNLDPSQVEDVPFTGLIAPSVGVKLINSSNEFQVDEKVWRTTMNGQEKCLQVSPNCTLNSLGTRALLSVHNVKTPKKIEEMWRWMKGECPRGALPR